jgi:hypothetical protein
LVTVLLSVDLDDLFQGEEHLWDLASDKAGRIISEPIYKAVKVLRNGNIRIQVTGYFEV